MITTLHLKRNQPYLLTLAFVLLVSWTFLTISASCIMPMPLAVTSMPDHIEGCLDAHSPIHTKKTMPNCALSSCIDSQTNSLTDFNRLTKPDISIFIPALFVTFFCLFLSHPPTNISSKASLPHRQRILLIYRFCTLLI